MKLREIFQIPVVVFISIVWSASSIFAQDVVPVKKMHLCSNEGNLWNYRSDCASQTPQLVINAVHVEADPLSQILRLQIISDNIGWYDFYLGKFARFDDFQDGELIEKGRTEIESLSGSISLQGKPSLLTERGGRSILDNTYSCSYSHPFQHLGFEKSLEGIKFDGRLEAYIEQFRFDKSEAEIFCKDSGRFEPDRLIRDVLYRGEKVRKTEANIKEFKERAEAAERELKQHSFILAEAIKKNDKKWQTTLSENRTGWIKAQEDSDERQAVAITARDEKYAAYYHETQAQIASLKASQNEGVATQLKQQETKFASEIAALQTQISNLKLEHLGQINQLKSQHAQELQSSNERIVSVQEKNLAAQNSLSQQMAELNSQNATFEASLRAEYEDKASAQSSSLWTAYGIIAFLVLCLGAMLKFAFRKPKGVV